MARPYRHLAQLSGQPCPPTGTGSGIGSGETLGRHSGNGERRNLASSPALESEVEDAGNDKAYEVAEVRSAKGVADRPRIKEGLPV